MANVTKDCKFVKILTAQARGENVDSTLTKAVEDEVKRLASSRSPEDMFTLSELIRYPVNEIVNAPINFLSEIADVKRVAYGDKAVFDVELDGIFAFIQAKGATTRRSKIASNAVTLETIASSVRPSMNILDLQYGRISMPRLITKASYELELAQLGYIQSVMTSAAAGWVTPYYGTGKGLIKNVLDPMIDRWMRTGGATIIGDISQVAQLAELTGFTAWTGGTQFSPDIINEQNRNGFIGWYRGARVVRMTNPFIAGSDNLALDPSNLYIMPNSADPSMRPLKVVYEGNLFSLPATHIDDLNHEVRMDQYFGAGIVYGDRPYVSVYHNSAN